MTRRKKEGDQETRWVSCWQKKVPGWIGGGGGVFLAAAAAAAAAAGSRTPVAIRPDSALFHIQPTTTTETHTHTPRHTDTKKEFTLNHRLKPTCDNHTIHVSC